MSPRISALIKKNRIVLRFCAFSKKLHENVNPKNSVRDRRSQTVRLWIFRTRSYKYVTGNDLRRRERGNAKAKVFDLHEEDKSLGFLCFHDWEVLVRTFGNCLAVLKALHKMWKAVS